MFKKITFLIVFFLSLGIMNAQKTVIENNPNYKYQSGNETTTQTVIKRTAPSFQQHWSFGGNLGLSFWNGGTDILIAPKAYYHLTPQFMVGPGLIYYYSSYDYRNYDYSYNSFGGSISGIYRPTPFLQLSTEFQELYTNREYKFTDSSRIEDSYWNSALYLGASFVSGNFAFGFQYDVLYDEGKSPYSSAWTPVISFYF